MVKVKQWLMGVGAAASLAASMSSQAGVILSEGFEGTALPTGWAVINRSTPVGPATWGKGNTNFFNAQSGTAGSYYADSFEAASQAGSTASIADYLITPTIQLNNGYTFSFWARSDGDPSFPDRLQLVMSTSGTSTAATSFATVLLSINPTVASGGFPTDWTQFTGTISGLAGLTTGRLAFLYSIPNALTAGDYIGVDNVVVTAVPEPESIALLALGLGAMGLSSRRRRGRASR